MHILSWWHNKILSIFSVFGLSWIAKTGFTPSRLDEFHLLLHQQSKVELDSCHPSSFPPGARIQVTSFKINKQRREVHLEQGEKSKSHACRACVQTSQHTFPILPSAEGERERQQSFLWPQSLTKHNPSIPSQCEPFCIIMAITNIIQGGRERGKERERESEGSWEGHKRQKLLSGSP